jgi:hypothetical protein
MLEIFYDLRRKMVLIFKIQKETNPKFLHLPNSPQIDSQI